MVVKVTPIKHYQNPSYPTRLVVDEHPGLLEMVPQRWQGNAAVLAALAGLSVLMAGARAVSSKDADQAVTPRVAPIFQHGEGRGSFGCIVVNPPVVLSEEEARKVIVEEAQRNGIKFKLINTKPDDMVTKDPETRPVAMDGIDEKRAISFEYVDTNLSYQWNRPKPKVITQQTGNTLTATVTGLASTVSTYDTKGAAEKIRDQIGKTEKAGIYGVFYDPLESYYTLQAAIPTLTPTKASVREFSREELRKQVRDFICWLKAQGVI